MKELFFIVISVCLLISCTRTENGIVFGTPDYEKRDIKVSKIDLEILLKAKELLSSQQRWRKDAQRSCDSKPPFNLYCALHTASIAITGKYIHRRPALQEVRFTINDNYKQRWKVHRLADFNNHVNTTYHDVIKALDITIDRVSQKLSVYSKISTDS